MQEFLHNHYKQHYDERHPDIDSTGEVQLINSYIPNECPHCTSVTMKKNGLTANGVQRYKCSECRQTFTPITHTIFDNHKISLSEWLEYSLNIFRYVSINADSWNNKNAFTTSRYWLEKLFLVLRSYPATLKFEGKIWFDETFYSVRSEDIERTESGGKLRGLSSNQMCIGVLCDKNKTLCIFEGFGQPKKSISYDSRELKRYTDADNPLQRVNHIHYLLKGFLYAHTSFNRDKLQDYLNLFTLVMNPPSNHLEKVEIILELAIKTRIFLRYRDFYNVN